MRALVLMLPALVAVAACGDDDAGLAAAAPTADAGTHRYLSQTGLYSDIATKTIAPELRAFTPRYPLWSDGAEKSRWVRLPAGAVVDTSDMEHWRFPVGTQLFVELRAGDGRRLETRMTERVDDSGDDSTDYWFGAFVWREDESDAEFMEGGMDDVRGTNHDAPAAITCRTCHAGEPGHGLGFSALQLAGDGPPGVRLGDLADEGLLSVVPASEYVVPGDPTTQAALGYLHANCGHCHNPAGSARPYVAMTLRLGLDATTVETTTVWTDTVDVPLFFYMERGLSLRVARGDAAHSAIVARMRQRGGRARQMPPIGTEFVDDAGVATVTAWIEGLARR